jgi:hypothetical protein
MVLFGCRYTRMALSYTVPNILQLTCKFFNKNILFNIFYSYVLCPFEIHIFVRMKSLMKHPMKVWLHDY